MGQLPSLLVSVLVALQAAPAQAGTEARPEKMPANPNERVCQEIKPVGSRLAVRRICATRAEWKEMRQQDRDVIDEAQRQVGLQRGH
jgi:hypothetical protein